MPEKSAEYWLTPEAERNMEAIWLYTLEEWGLEQAYRYIDELTEALSQLAVNPKMAVSLIALVKGIGTAKLDDMSFISGKQITA